MLSLAEAAARLSAPDAPESFSPVAGEPLVVVDLASEGELAADALAALPCVVVGVAPEGRPLRAAARRLDVVVSDLGALARLEECVRRTPLAAVTLVQLLRHNEGAPAGQGLLAESLAYSTLQAGPEFASWLAARPRKPPAPAAAGPAVRVRRERDCLLLTLDRPARHNAYSAAMRDALVEALALAVSDPSLRELVLDGAGPSFCSGGDLDEFGSRPDPATAHAVRSTRNAARLLAACGARATARVHGACIGAGVELAAFCARVVAAPDAVFQLPELAMGLVPGAGGTVSLPRRIGRQRTAWLALSGERIEATTAHAWGLVDEIRERG
jgi:Enoyl-CoA hydratase/isomerase